jgi:4-hydroxy-3-polyprenylbenzoate decarboxylase
MAATDLVLALTGASGTPYGIRLLEVMLCAGCTVHLSIRPSAVEVMEREVGRTVHLNNFIPADLLGDLARSVDT